MSGQDNKWKPDAGFERDKKTTEQAEAGALLARLAALETDAAPLSEAQQAALYRRAMEKAGLTGQSAVGDAIDTEEPTAAETASPKKKLIRWQRWALSAAAALAVMVLGTAALVSGGFRMNMGMAEAQYSTETAMDTAAPEPRETAPEVEEDSPAEITMDSLTADHAAGIAESSAPDMNAPADEKAAEETIAEEPTVKEPVSGETGEAIPPEESTEDCVEECPPEEEIIGTDSIPGTAANGSGTELLMVNGQLYRGTALVLEPSVSSTERLARIAATVAAEELPTADGQANFDAAGAPYLYWRSGLAVLLDGEWRFFEPVE